MDHAEINRYHSDLHGEFFVSLSETKRPPLNTFHIHDAYEIMLLLSDDIQVLVNEETYPVPYGSLLLFNTMDLHLLRYTGNDTYKRFVLWFKPSFLDDLESIRFQLMKCFFIRGFDKPNLLTLDPDQLDSFLQKFNTLNQTAGEASPLRDVRLKLILGELLAAVNEIRIPTSSKEISEKTSGETSVFKAIGYIQENYSRKIDLDSLSKAAGSCKRTLCTHFRILTGMTPGQYILNCRLNAAKSYLGQGFSVTEVCGKTGFENWSNFSRTFRNHVGLSPKQYAMKYRL